MNHSYVFVVEPDKFDIHRHLHIISIYHASLQNFQAETVQIKFLFGLADIASDW